MEVKLIGECSAPLLQSVRTCLLLTTSTWEGQRRLKTIPPSVLFRLCAHTYLVTVDRGSADTLDVYRTLAKVFSDAPPALFLQDSVVFPSNVTQDLAASLRNVELFVSRGSFGCVTLGSIGPMTCVDPDAQMFRFNSHFLFAHAVILERKALRLLCVSRRPDLTRMEDVLSTLGVASHSYRIPIVSRRTDRDMHLPPVVRRLLSHPDGWKVLYAACRNPVTTTLGVVNLLCAFCVCLHLVTTLRRSMRER